MTAFDARAEFDRQVNTLVAAGYPGLAGMTEADFHTLVEPLREPVLARAAASASPSEGRVPFLLVVTRALVPLEEAVPLTTLAGKRSPGVIERFYAPGELERFVSLKELALPEGEVYVVFDVERGEEFCGAVPVDALATRRGAEAHPAHHRGGHCPSHPVPAGTGQEQVLLARRQPLRGPPGTGPVDQQGCP